MKTATDSNTDTTVKKFRPHDVEEETDFENKHCHICIHGNESEQDYCSIRLAAMLYGADESGYPEEWQFKDGKPTCTAFEER